MRRQFCNELCLRSITTQLAGLTDRGRVGTFRDVLKMSPFSSCLLPEMKGYIFNPSADLTFKDMFLAILEMPKLRFFMIDDIVDEKDRLLGLVLDLFAVLFWFS